MNTIYNPSFFGFGNNLILDKNDIYKGMPQGELPDDPVPDYKSSLGTPVMCDLTILGGTYTADDGTKYAFNDIKFDTVVMVLNQTKNIVKTNIQGLDGTIKEYIGMGDYTIQVQTVLSFPTNTYDRDAIIACKKVFTAPVSLKCVSWFLQLWDIDELVIESYDIPQIAGYYSQQPIAINASSNKIVEILIS